MDNKTMQEIFDCIWKRYLALEKEIWELSAKYEENPSEIVKETIYNLCEIALGLLSDLEYSATKLFDGVVLDNYQNVCKVKRNDLQDISSKTMSSKTK